MAFILGLLVPVLAYGVLCALLGVLVERETRPYRAQWALSARVRLLDGLARLKAMTGRLSPHGRP
jgi:hypothetical protein